MISQNPDDTDALLVWSNAPDAAQAAKLAETLVMEKLAACVHVLPQGYSYYEWDKRLNRDTEWTLMIKTRQTIYPVLEARIKALHPYDVPEIIATPVVQGLPAYLAWMKENTR